MLFTTHYYGCPVWTYTGPDNQMPEWRHLACDCKSVKVVPVLTEDTPQDDNDPVELDQYPGPWPGQLGF